MGRAALRKSEGRTPKVELERKPEGRKSPLELDRLITKRYALAEIGEGYRAQAAGDTIRGLLVHA